MAPAGVLPSAGTLLLERDAQIAALKALADAARSGAGRFAVIEGSAGIGKTRLLGDARARRAWQRVRGRVCVRDRPSAVRAAARVRVSGSPRRTALGPGRAH